MSDQTPVLDLPLLQPAQAQKHVTHNAAIDRLDQLVQTAVESFEADLPPALPAPGETHALGAAPQGAWAGSAPGTLARWDGTAWRMTPPRTGWRAWGKDVAALKVWDGAAWTVVTGETENLDGVGIGTASDATNRLAVAAEAVLFSHAAAGQDHRLKVNKAGAADTASLLFQSGWSARAEMGLTGSEDFSVKVSADGSAWTEAMTVAAASGHVGLGIADPEEQLHVAEGAAFGAGTGGTYDANLRILPSDRFPRIQVNSGTLSSDCQITFDALNGAFYMDIATQTGFAQWRAKDNGSYVSLMRLTEEGDLGLGTTAPQRKLHVNAVMRLQPGAAPADAAAGDIYFDSGTAKLRCHDGTTWHDLF